MIKSKSTVDVHRAKKILDNHGYNDQEFPTWYPNTKPSKIQASIQEQKMNKGPIKFANKIILKPTKEQVNYARVFK